MKKTGEFIGAFCEGMKEGFVISTLCAGLVYWVLFTTSKVLIKFGKEED